MIPSKETPVARKIYVDASHTSSNRLNGGVQRVVRNICELTNGTENCAEAKTISVKDLSFWVTDLKREAVTTERVHLIRANAVESMPRAYKGTAQLLCNMLPISHLRRWLLPKPGHLGIFKLPLKVYETWQSRGTRRQEALPGDGDVLLLPDAYWARSQVWPAVEAAKARGAKIAVVVYDMIPLTHPHFVSAKAVEPFRKYLQDVAKHADMVVAISDTVRQQVESLFRQPGFSSNCNHFSSFELGAEFQVAEGVVRDQLRDLFRQPGAIAPHLMVATFDPRKNHHYALDAFERVWETRPDVKFCLIGRVGWLCEDVIARVRSHARLGKQLFAFHDVNDAELYHCYQRARSVVMPSIVEGFGLPIVEALWHGRQVFASNTPIHREVGRNECIYFDLAQPGSLAEKLLDWESQQGADSPYRNSTYRPVSWDESVQGLVAQCVMTLFPTADRKRRAA
ncbi:MAG: glycosyltransferase family 1 protein [Aureliella sp.]